MTLLINIKTQHSQLENGVRVITEHVPSTGSAGLSLLIDASPQVEPVDRRGLAHVCEHALFLGTPQRNGRELARTMDSAGGCFGAFTAPDFTCVYAHVAAFASGISTVDAESIVLIHPDLLLGCNDLLSFSDS